MKHIIIATILAVSGCTHGSAENIYKDKFITKPVRIMVEAFLNNDLSAYRNSMEPQYFERRSQSDVNIELDAGVQTFDQWFKGAKVSDFIFTVEDVRLPAKLKPSYKEVSYGLRGKEARLRLLVHLENNEWKIADPTHPHEAYEK
ncbi:hypothetical protein [Tichowtungia aerotolerans]|uniref:Lipoprotein n=1 Tax=Tichowtungia aerotolerans TaxID=2697043 RepID=A0A6P1M4M0_9BACT|nr:hypothetical protein [Tichowtungia aerotolerans]QHI69002.1 hypothetical protein GT409_05920 [Tichowtungia aerotolerans]